MRGRVASIGVAELAVLVAVVFCVVVGALLASGAATAEVRGTVSTPDAVQYGDGEGLDGSASDAAITASQAFREPGSGSSGEEASASESASTPESASTGAAGETVEATPTSERTPVAGAADHDAEMTELPETGGAPVAPLLGAALVAGGMLVGAAGRGGR